MEILQDLRGDLFRLRARSGERDGRMQRLSAARKPGGLKIVFPDLFPDDGPYSEPSVANMVDIAARDIAEVLAPLPTFNCSSSTAVSDRARKFAEKRTKIAYHYVDASNLAVNNYVACDRYVSYGFVPAVVTPDFDRQVPVIQFLDSVGTYFHRNQWGRVTRLFHSMSIPRDELLAMYPQCRKLLDDNHRSGDVEIVRFWDDNHIGMFCNVGVGQLCELVTNPIGIAPVHVFHRPGLSDDEVGQFDDILMVQAVKARMYLLSLEAATKAVQAPTAMPNDVQEFGLGSDAVIHSSRPDQIRRVDLTLPPSTFATLSSLDQELRQGSRHPEVRGGNSDASVITGRGVQALMAGFDTQVKTGNAIFAHGLQYLISLCFQMDEKIWPNTEKTVRGNANGTPYEVKYIPSKDIKGDTTVDVQYGLMAGLNPNQALVFGLQALGADLISKRFLRTQLPFSMDPSQEEQTIDIEALRESLKGAIAGYVQAIPVLAQNGQDPMEIISRVAEILIDRQRGTSLEEAATKAFQPKEDPNAAALGAPGMPGGDPGALGGDGLAPSGLMAGVAPGQQALGPGGSPDIMTLLAGLNGKGQPSLGAGVSRRLPI